MERQTHDYITLKPIAERFKEVAISVSDKEIKAIIESELRKQISEQVRLGSMIQEFTEDWLYDNEDFVKNCIKQCIETKFSK